MGASKLLPCADGSGLGSTLMHVLSKVVLVLPFRAFCVLRGLMLCFFFVFFGVCFFLGLGDEAVAHPIFLSLEHASQPKIFLET